MLTNIILSPTRQPELDIGSVTDVAPELIVDVLSNLSAFSAP